MQGDLLEEKMDHHPIWCFSFLSTLTWDPANSIRHIVQSYNAHKYTEKKDNYQINNFKLVHF